MTTSDSKNPETIQITSERSDGVADRLLRSVITGSVMGLVFFLVMTSCKDKADDKNMNPTPVTGFEQVNLVADTAGFNAQRVDPNLGNAWGIAQGPTGAFWIAASATDMSTVYDRNGAEVIAPVSLSAGSAPTGIVYNSTTSFGGSKFIFVGENGKISTWTAGATTVVSADRSASGAVYKGIALGQDNGKNLIYAANFHSGKVDVFDENFLYDTSRAFVDPSMPAGFAPFNIYNLDGKLYVVYAKQLGPDNMDDQPGAGNGYVSVFNTDGTFVQRFASGGSLNSPWAIVRAPSSFGLGPDAILVGNFGDGAINIYSSDGSFRGQLKDLNGATIKIDGLWALAFSEDSSADPDQRLYFTAGPQDENHGIFGYLILK